MVPDQKTIDLNKRMSQLLKIDYPKKCCFPKAEECDKIIKAHSIQHHGILNKIANDGKVIALTNYAFVANELETIGIKTASTFQGFCSKHDSTIFKPIEDNPYTKTEEQNFLFAYRAVCCEYSNIYRGDFLFQKMLYENPLHQAQLAPKLHSVRHEVNEYLSYVEEFNVEFVKTTPNFSIIKSEVFKVEYEALFALNSAFSPSIDFSSNLINDLKSVKTPIPLFVNAFPQNGKTYTIISYFQKDHGKFGDFFTYLHDADEIQLSEGLSNIFTIYCGNLYISPLKWVNIPKSVQNKFLKRIKVIERDQRTDLKEKPPINFFTDFS